MSTELCGSICSVHAADLEECLVLGGVFGDCEPTLQKRVLALIINNLLRSTNCCQLLQTLPWWLPNLAKVYSRSAQQKPRERASQTEGLGRLQFSMTKFIQSNLEKNVYEENRVDQCLNRVRKELNMLRFLMLFSCSVCHARDCLLHESFQNIFSFTHSHNVQILQSSCRN